MLIPPTAANPLAVPPSFPLVPAATTVAAATAPNAADISDVALATITLSLFEIEIQRIVVNCLIQHELFNAHAAFNERGIYLIAENSNKEPQLYFCSLEYLSIGLVKVPKFKWKIENELPGSICIKKAIFTPHDKYYRICEYNQNLNKGNETFYVLGVPAKIINTTLEKKNVKALNFREPLLPTNVLTLHGGELGNFENSDINSTLIEELVYSKIASFTALKHLELLVVAFNKHGIALLVRHKLDKDYQLYRCRSLNDYFVLINDSILQTAEKLKVYEIMACSSDIFSWEMGNANCTINGLEAKGIIITDDILKKCNNLREVQDKEAPLPKIVNPTPYKVKVSQICCKTEDDRPCFNIVINEKPLTYPTLVSEEILKEMRLNFMKIRENPLYFAKRQSSILFSSLKAIMVEEENSKFLKLTLKDDVERNAEFYIEKEGKEFYRLFKHLPTQPTPLSAFDLNISKTDQMRKFFAGILNEDLWKTLTSVEDTPVYEGLSNRHGVVVYNSNPRKNNGELNARNTKFFFANNQQPLGPIPATAGDLGEIRRGPSSEEPTEADILDRIRDRTTYLRLKSTDRFIDACVEENSATINGEPAIKFSNIDTAIKTLCYSKIVFETLMKVNDALHNEVNLIIADFTAIAEIADNDSTPSAKTEDFEE